MKKARRRTEAHVCIVAGVAARVARWTARCFRLGPWATLGEFRRVGHKTPSCAQPGGRGHPSLRGAWCFIIDVFQPAIVYSSSVEGCNGGVHTTVCRCRRMARGLPTATERIRFPTIRSCLLSKATARGATSGRPRCGCSTRRWRRPTRASGASSGTKCSPARRPWRTSTPGCRTTAWPLSANFALPSRGR